jgi:hypothetical protein
MALARGLQLSRLVTMRTSTAITARQTARGLLQPLSAMRWKSVRLLVPLKIMF